MSLALSAYLALSSVAAPFAGPILRRRLARGKEEAGRLGERQGRAGLARPPGPLVWLHGASVGEAMTALPLAAALRAEPSRPTVLLTTGTVTSAARVSALAPAGVLHQYVPVDTAPAVRRFLRHWRPDVAIWIESEFWPRLMVETARAGVPMFLMNARLSARSAASWARRPAMARKLIGLFRTIMPQDAETVRRLTALGADPARLDEPANLKMLIPPPEADAAAVAGLRESLSGRPVWLAASTHPGEEAMVIAAHRALLPRRPGLLTILAPRHPDRGEALAAEIHAAWLSLARRSEGAGPPEGGIWLADTLGEMGLWYRLAPVALVGGSLVAMGGHNPFEPAALGAAILHGPHTENFAPAYAALAAAGGARAVTDGASMATALEHLIAADGAPTPAQAAMTTAAAAVLEAGRPEIERYLRPLRAALAERRVR
ncbi:MAG: glycosyltransferase N-terminal domain-containing protein [Pseudomonadota bacterium]